MQEELKLLNLSGLKISRRQKYETHPSEREAALPHSSSGDVGGMGAGRLSSASRTACCRRSQATWRRRSYTCLLSARARRPAATWTSSNSRLTSSSSSKRCSRSSRASSEPADVLPESDEQPVRRITQGEGAGRHLFCKLTYLTRQKFFARHQHSGPVSAIPYPVHRHQVCRRHESGVRSANLQPFFVNTSEDLRSLLAHLEQTQIVRMKSSNTQRAAYSLNYALMVLIPLLGTFFDHLASNEFGANILLGDIQHACYKILDCLYRIGTTYAASYAATYGASAREGHLHGTGTPPPSDRRVHRLVRGVLPGCFPRARVHVSQPQLALLPARQRKFSLFCLLVFSLPRRHGDSTSIYSYIINFYIIRVFCTFRINSGNSNE